MSRYLIEKKRQQGEINYTTSFLIDDIASELDGYSCRLILRALFKNKDQCIFTSISKEALSFLTELTDTPGKFHVEHGKIQTEKPAV